MPTSKKRREQRKLLQSFSTLSTTDKDISLSPCFSSLSDKEIALAALTQPVCIEASPDVQIQGVEGKGRGLFWCPADGRTLEKGSTIVRLQPENMVLDERCIKSHCHVCYRTRTTEGKAPKCCPGCNLIRYCSSKCQKADHDLHKKECQALVSFARMYSKTGEVVDPGASIRQTARILWQRDKMGKNWWKKIEALLLHPDKSRDTDALLAHHEATKEMPNFLSKILMLCDYLTGRPPNMLLDRDDLLDMLGYPNLQELGDLYSRVNFTALNLLEADGQESVGTALSIVCGMVNHSCVPNSNMVYPNGPGVKDPLHIVNLKELKAGEEITMAYRDECKPYALRQAQLQDDYFFHCRCPLCLKSERALAGKSNRVDPREALWCGRDNCNGWMTLDWKESKPKGRCTGCKQASVLDSFKVANIIIKSKKLLEALENDRDIDKTNKLVLESCDLLKELSAIQPPSSHPLLSLFNYFWISLDHMTIRADCAEDALEAVRYREESIRIGSLIMAGWQAGKHGGMVPEGHSARGTLLAKLATMLLLKPYQREEAQWAADNASKSLYLSRVPALPHPGLPRIEFGLKVAKQALFEIGIGFGDDSGDCNMHKIMVAVIAKWRQGMVVDANGMKVGLLES